MGLFQSPVYLVDLHCYKPPDELRMNIDKALEWWSNNKTYPESVIDFNKKIAKRSGLSNTHTHLMHHTNPEHCGDEVKIGYNESIAEMELSLFGAVEGLLEKTNISPKDVDILVTCCSIFCPTPSMTAAIVNRFKMRPDIQSYHLGGMGCSMGVVSVNLIRDLLKAHPNSVAMLCTTEITTPAFYTGTDRSRVVTNLLFRMGGAAMLFTNRPTRKLRPKYKLRTAIRVHRGFVDAAYKCITYSPDEEGINGVFLGKDVVTEASKGLEKVITKIAPYVLDLTQIAVFLFTEFRRKFIDKNLKSFTPSFEKCLDHVLIHAGGAKVLEGLGQNLQLSDYTLKPSYDVLYYFGNVSSSTTWYTLSNIESFRGVKKGDRVMQVGVGSGLKCGVNLWTACRDIWEIHPAWKEQAKEQGVKPRIRKRSFITRFLIFTLILILIFGLLYVFLLRNEFSVLDFIPNRGLVVNRDEL
eukprot:g4029.t1